MDLFFRAKRVIPGGVNSPVRSFQAVGGEPIFIKQGKGSCLLSEDGQEYLDYVLSWGALILGHLPEVVVNVIQEQLHKGTSFGMCTEIEVLFAEQIVKLIPSIEMIRMVNSGTEATMSAVRLARGHTGRDLVVKFSGCYHGHADTFLVQAGSGFLTHSLPNSQGILQEVVQKTVVVNYNDSETLEMLFDQKGEEIACVIVEPVAGNMGVVPPTPFFLSHLRKLTEKYGVLLIFDEVITGFRLGLSGAQGYYGIKPDLTTLGKIIGGGLPVGAYGGGKTIMEKLAPQGMVYQAGTLAGNPLALRVGYATVKNLVLNPHLYQKLEEMTKRLVLGMKSIMQERGIPIWINWIGSMFTPFFTSDPVVDYHSALRADITLYRRFFHAMLQEGIFIPPSQFEAWFLSTAHTDEDINRTLEATSKALKKL
ncbi:MAG: glutamate-1-semialdehyde 2,1-aminomutase [Candidatus Caldatribacteriaceae bacterium]